MTSKLINDDLTTSHPEFSRAAAGIISPTVRKLDRSQVIFRFASTERIVGGGRQPTNSADWAKGAWWVLEEDYRKIINRFLKGQLPLGTVARSAAAVQPSWSLMDVSIKAYLLHDMNVFMGQGAPQYKDVLPNGMQMTLAGWADITQIYIPNLFALSKAVQSNIRVTRQKRIQSNSWGF